MCARKNDFLHLKTNEVCAENIYFRASKIFIMQKEIIKNKNKNLKYSQRMLLQMLLASL